MAGLPGVFLAVFNGCYLALLCVQRYPVMADTFSGACGGSWHGSLGGQLTRMAVNTTTSTSFGTTLLDEELALSRLICSIER